MLFRRLAKKTECPACGKTLLWKGLRHTQEYDLKGKPWYKFVSANAYCPFCNTRLEIRSTFKYFVAIFLILHFTSALYVIPDVKQHFGYSWLGLTVIVAWAAVELAVLWLGRCFAGFQEPK